LAIPVLVILGLLWAAVLVPPLFRARSERRGGSTIGDFSQSLGVIGRTGGYSASRAVPPIRLSGVARRRTPVGTVAPGRGPALAGPPVMKPAQRRRRDVLLTLGVVVVVTLLAGLLTGSMAVWVAQVAADLLLVAYVALLVRMRTLASEQSAKVRYLPSQTPQLALRRTVSS